MRGLIDNIPSLFDIFPDLTPEEAGALALGAFLLLILLDIYATIDNVANNTPRQVAVAWASRTKRALGILWTGAPIPFMLGALVGHWFHPGLPRPPESWPGLAIVIGMALLASPLIGLTLRGDDHPPERWVLWSVAAIGTIAAVFLWPVSV